MKMSMQLSMKARIELSAQQRMEMRVELAERVGCNIQALIQGTDYSRETLYDLMLVNTMEAITELLGSSYGYQKAKDFSRGVVERLMAPNIKSESLSQPSRLAVDSSEEELRAFIVECLWKDLEATGGFVPKGASFTQPLETTRGALYKAFLDAEELDAEIESLVGLAQSTKQATDGLLDSLHESRNAQLIAKQVGPIVDNLVEIIQSFAMKAVDLEGHRPYPEFFRELIIKDRLVFLISDQLLNKASNFLREAYESDSLDEEAPEILSDTIGAFVLTSMGIISPDVCDFPELDQSELPTKLKKALEDPVVRLWYKDGSTAIVPFRFLPKNSDLREFPSLSESHWEPIKGRRKIVVDNNSVKAFVSETVMADRAVILGALALEKLIVGVTKVCSDGGEDDQIVLIGELLADALDSEKFLELIRERIMSDSWFKALGHFFLNKEET